MFQSGEFVKCTFDEKCQYCISKKYYNIPIGCISLKESKQRSEVEKQYHRFGYCQNAGFWIVDRHPNGGKEGCFESHKALNHYFNQQGFEKAIILEDDVKILKKIPKYINKLPKDAYILYLGWYPSYCNGIENYKRVNDHFLQGPFLTTHAYLSTTKLMNWVEKLEYQDQHIDQIFSKNISKNSYGLYPIIAVQKNELDSSISKLDIFRYIDKENFMLSMSHITSNTEYNVNIIILLIVILIVVLIITIVAIIYVK